MTGSGIDRDKRRLNRLGAGELIGTVCAADGIDRAEFDSWWQQTVKDRVPEIAGARTTVVRHAVEIERDQWGIPHVYAENDADLFFGFGYAMAQDRLFQLDYLRRKASGRLSEILGPEAVDVDIVARTVGLRRIAEAEWHRLPEETKSLLEAFSSGINDLIEQTCDRPPIEFDLLDYRPGPWSPIDCLAVECEFRWYLTGRFPVIVMPELAKRALGDGPLYREFLMGEADDETIIPSTFYPPINCDPEAVGQAAGDPDASTGSNNWVVSGVHTAGGAPMVASDPHIAFEAVSCWYEVHLCGGSFNTAGMAYAGMPAVMFGRNERVAWGITNNICSQRDLYQERISPEHPGCFYYQGRWEPARELTETIHVRGGESLEKTVRFSRNGPIVDEILPPPANKTGPVSLKWLGAYQGGWLTSLLSIDRAGDVESFREALREWHVPTFSLVFADVDKNIGFQTSGRIPLRAHAERGYRPGWDPQHQWQGLIPFEVMPGVINPKRGWMISANNRLAPDNYPYPLAGTWGSGYRAQRIRQMITRGDDFERDNFRDMQQDSLSLRAVNCVPELIDILAESDDPRVSEAVEHLRQWDCRTDTDRYEQTMFSVFSTNWFRAVAAERFEPETAALLVGGIEALSMRLVCGDECGWFADSNRIDKIEDAFRTALETLAERFGDDMTQWAWGRLHQMPLKHVLSARGDLSQLLDHGGDGVKGDAGTVCNTGNGADWSAATGAGYRMIADLQNAPAGLWAIDGQSQSGHPGSPHYGDQLGDWIDGNYHFVSLNRADASKSTVNRLRLEPLDAGG